MLVYNQLDNVSIELRENNKGIGLYVLNSNILISTFDIDAPDFNLILDTCTLNDKTCHLSGWSLDNIYKLPPKCIMIFEKNRLKKIIKTMTHRADVAMAHSCFVDHLGFDFKFRTNKLEDLTIVCIRPSNKAVVINL